MNATAADLLGRGDRLLDEGRWTDAAAIYRDISKQFPGHIPARFNLGVALSRAGMLRDAEEAYRSVLSLQPDMVVARFNLALILQGQSRLAEAIDSYRAVLELVPDWIDAKANLAVALRSAGDPAAALPYFIDVAASRADAASDMMLGTVLKELQRLPEAIAAFERAVNRAPQDAMARFQLGMALAQHGDAQAALTQFNDSVALNPKFAAAQINLGVTLRGLGQPDAAYAALCQAQTLAPDSPVCLAALADTMQDLERFDEALPLYRQALAIRPDHADTLAKLAAALIQLHRPDEAIEAIQRALALRPEDWVAWAHLGNAEAEAGRTDAAITAYRRALDINPTVPESWCNLGVALRDAERFDESFACYARALPLAPDFAVAHWNEALGRLLLGDFERGWSLYEWRFQRGELLRTARQFDVPLWVPNDSEDAGKRILIHAEQGLGDTLQFVRYIAFVRERGIEVTLEVQPRLQRLIAQSLPDIEVLPRGAPWPAVDCHCPLLSLPHRFGTNLATIPAAVPYLVAHPASPARPFSVGLAWAGNPRHPNDHNRSLALDQLMPLLHLEPVHFVSLQKDVPARDQSTLGALGDRLEQPSYSDDFVPTAERVAALDLIICVDSAIAHLAGGLARPVWILLPRVPDWRWLRDRSDSPWYPTATLFRQSTPGDWESVILLMRVRLAELVDSTI
jgi:tetratricopeptide (TPR) repeat protein